MRNVFEDRTRTVCGAVPGLIDDVSRMSYLARPDSPAFSRRTSNG